MAMRAMQRICRLLVLALLAALPVSSLGAEDTLVEPFVANWKYLDDGSDPGAD